MPDYAEVRWGIIGPGSIAHSLAKAVAALPNTRVTAVGSRDQARGDAFAAQYGIPTVHASYQALVEDPEVDAVYVATPHTFQKSTRCWR